MLVNALIGHQVLTMPMVGHVTAVVEALIVWPIEQTRFAYAAMEWSR